MEFATKMPSDRVDPRRLSTARKAADEDVIATALASRSRLNLPSCSDDFHRVRPAILHTRAHEGGQLDGTFG